MKLVKLDLQQKQSKLQNIHWVMLFDRSGSMWADIDQLIDDIQGLVTKLNDGDVVTLGWFSGEEGQYQNFVVNSPVTDFSKENILIELDKQRHTLNTTCYSEILEDVTKHLGIYSLPIMLEFFTDGHIVVRNPEKEKRNIFEALDKLKIHNSLFIGYGGSYDKQFLTKMADRIGGAVIHANHLERFTSQSELFLDNAEESTFVEGDVIYIKDNVLVRDNNIPTSAIAYKLVEEQPDFDDLESIYGLAALYVRETKVDQALELVRSIGDVFFIEGLYNAFTVEDYSKWEELLLLALTNEAYRYREGINLNTQPKAKLSVLELLQLLAKDPKAFLHKDFIYKPISKGGKRTGPKFIPNQDYYPLFGLIFNKERANVSLNTAQDGFIKLPKDKPESLPDILNVKSYKNYSIIVDGRLNVAKIPVEMSKDTYEQIKDDLNLVAWEDNRVFELDLTKLPLIHNVELMKAEELVVLYETQLNLEAQLKVYNYLLKDNVDLTSPYTKEEQDYLKSIGVYGDAYSAKYEKYGSFDHYMAKSLSFKKDGFRSLPSAKSVQQKMKEGKGLTSREELMSYSFIEATDHELKMIIKDTNKGLQRIRNLITEQLWGVIICKKWFSDLDSFEAKINDWEIVMKEVKVKI